VVNGDRAAESVGSGSTTARLAISTAPSEEVATRLARSLVERGFCACVSVLPNVRSFYRWQGAIEEAHEWLLLMKTEAREVDRLRDALLAEHPYDVPEFLVLDVASGSAGYLAWLSSSCAGGAAVSISGEAKDA